MRRLRENKGATLVEYALLMALVVVVSLGAISALQDSGDEKVAQRSDGIGAPPESNSLNGPGGGGGGGGGDGSGDGGGGEASVVHVESIVLSTGTTGNNWTATAIVTVTDENGDPVAGVDVSGSWDAPDGNRQCGPTDSDGQCTVTSPVVQRKPDAGATMSLTFTISELSGPLSTYDPSANTTSSSAINRP